MHDRPAVRAEREQGATVRGIARERGASRNAVRRALAPGARDRYWRPSPTEAAEAGVRDMLADYPQMSARDIEAVVDWPHSYRALAALVARLRPEYLGEPGLRARPLDSIQRGILGVQTIKVGVMARGKATVGAGSRTGAP
ncbi:hypothetical protein [Georgenia wangjunii]|uniref:hypothetical protein n=1 Tax=Georgenia wangjunii TaxID=3117730 RepID=UPI002F2698DF